LGSHVKNILSIISVKSKTPKGALVCRAKFSDYPSAKASHSPKFGRTTGISEIRKQ